MDPTRSSVPDRLFFFKIPISIPIATTLTILISLAFNLVFTFSDLGGTSIRQQLLAGLGGMVIAPAFYALAIWGLVYPGLLAVIAYQFGIGREFRRSYERWHEPQFQRINQFLMGVVICQAVWAGLFAANQPGWASLAMAGVLMFLIKTYSILGISPAWSSARRRWLCYAPISFYLGWATVLTVITVAMGLYTAGWQVGGIFWGVVVISAMMLFSAAFIANYKDVLFTLGVVWGLVMIAIQQQELITINLVSAFGAAILVFWLVWIKNPPRQKYFY